MESSDMSMSLDPRQVFRNFVTDGVASSDEWEPRKAEIRQMLFSWWQNIIALVADAGDLTLPNLMISWAITGGDANDIVAEPSSEDYSPGSQIHMIVFAAPNTGDMTLNSIPLRLNNGAEIPAGYFPANVAALFRQTNTEWRLLTFGDPEAVQAEVEAVYQDVLTAQGAAEAAAALAQQRFIRVHVVDTDEGNPATDYEAGDEIDGVTLATGNLVLRATDGGDPADGIYVVPASGAAARSSQFDDYDDLPGTGIRVMLGTDHAGTDWRVNSAPGGTINVTDVLIEGLSAGGTGSVGEAADLAALRLINTAKTTSAVLTESGRAGTFIWNADVSASLLGGNIASSAVDAGTETITSNAHGLITGQAVITTTAVNGLSLNTLYYVIRVTANTYRLASSFANAKAGTAFNLTGTSAVTVKRHNDPLSGVYVTPDADLSGASGAWVRQHSSPYNVKWFGAKGTGSADDDTHPFQAAIFFAENTSLRIVFIPSHNVSAYYKITSELWITKPIEIVGEHKMLTVAASGMTNSDYMFRCDGTIFPNLENVVFRNFTIRPFLSGSAARGVLLNRVAKPLFEDVILFNPFIGVYMTGDRGFGSVFRSVEFSGASQHGFLMEGYTGGGHHNFYGGAFNGCVTGFRQFANSAVRSLNFFGTSWEGCTQAFEMLGDVAGCTLSGCYTEANLATGGASFRFAPAAGKAQRGILIHGGAFHTSQESYLALMGGAGSLTSFSVIGVETFGYATALIRRNGSGAGGHIVANYLQNMTAIVSNGPFPDTGIGSNYNSSGLVTS